MVDSTGSECTLCFQNWRGSDLQAFKARIAEVKLAEAKHAFKFKMLEPFNPKCATQHNTVSYL